MKKKIISAILTAALALSLAGCGGNAAGTSKQSSGDGKLTTIRVAIMTNSCDHWEAAVGNAEGLWAKHGINLQTAEFAAGINTVDAVVTGQADIGNLADYACVNRLGTTQDDTDLVIIDRLSTAENTDDSATGLYVSKEINSIEDLKGVPFATQTGTVWDYWVAKTYQKAGISQADQNIVQLDSASSAVAAMTKGDVKAFWASGSNAAKLEQAGFKKLMTLDELGVYTDAYFISTKKYVDANEKTVEKFIEAQHDIGEWIEKNPDKAAEDFSKASGQTKEQFLADLKASHLVTDFTQKTLDHLNDIKDWAVESKRFKDYNIMDYADFTPLKAVYPDSVTVEDK